VFGRFHRELGSGVEGSGLGLAIVAEAIQRHDGDIALDASPTLGGLRATVSLPADRAGTGVSSAAGNS
jgi:two-component system sensor histidine kinase QseC